MSLFTPRMNLPLTNSLPLGPNLGSVAQFTHDSYIVVCHPRESGDPSSSYAKTLLTSERGFFPPLWRLLTKKAEKKEAIRTAATLLDELKTKASTFEDELNSHFLQIPGIESPWPVIEKLCQRIHHHRSTLAGLKLQNELKVMEAGMSDILEKIELAFDGEHIRPYRYLSYATFAKNAAVELFYRHPTKSTQEPPKLARKKFRAPLSETSTISSTVTVNLELE